MLIFENPVNPTLPSAMRERLGRLRIQREAKRAASQALHESMHYERECAHKIELTLPPGSDYLGRTLADLASVRHQPGRVTELDEARRAARHRGEEARYRAEVAKVSEEAAALNTLVVNCEKFLFKLEAQ